MCVCLLSLSSRVMTLNAGDIILTGTPEGVGKVQHGETITCGITDVVKAGFTVARS